MSETTTNAKVTTTHTYTWDPTTVVETFEEPSASLRWEGKILAQQWRLIRIGNAGQIVSIDHEWRPVPTALPDR